MAKLGTSKKPAVARVGTEARAQEILRICKENDWQVIVGIEPDEPENISDVKRLLNRRKMEPTIFSPQPAPMSIVPAQAA